MAAKFLIKKQKRELKELIKNKSDYNSKEISRAQIVLLLNEGTSCDNIIMLTGYKKRRIYQVRAAYLSEGITGILDKRKPSRKSLLSKEERDEICEILLQNTPLDYGYSTEFWSTALLADLIESRYNVRYASKTSYYLLFKKAKFSFHKPGRVYEKKDYEITEKWRKSVKKQIKKVWTDENVVILTADEMVLSTQTTFQKVWLQQGEYPKIEVSNTKKNRSIYGFLNIKTGQEHAYKRLKQNMNETVSCLKNISKIYAGKKILLIWDGAGWHKGSKVLEFIEKTGNIEVVYFPPYSPEENPQEHVWKSGRQEITHNKFIEDIDSATDEFISYLRTTKFKYDFLGFSAK